MQVKLGRICPALETQGVCSILPTQSSPPATLQPPLTSQPWGSSPTSWVFRLEKHSRGGVGGWINPTGGRDWVEWGEDAGIESIYHALEARSSLIAHEAL